VTLSRFFRTPKGLALIVLALLTVVAAAGEGFILVAPGIAGAVIPAMLIDAIVLRRIKARWVFPSGALLTGLIVAMILSPREPWHVAAITAIVGVLSKYVVRVRTANVFNPAALALVATFYVFNTAQSWWGALPEISPLALAVLLATGAFIAYKVNKVPAVLAFLGAYYLFATITAFAGDPRRVAELYRAPDLHAALYFAFFMVTDPPTSPPKHRDQLVFGVIVAAASYAAFELIGAAYFLLAGLLVANAWEGWRRARARAHR
jgi:Na+-translocating ferredoxin:NAD+ oxidoreductase RnfD subunit